METQEAMWPHSLASTAASGSTRISRIQRSKWTIIGASVLMLAPCIVVLILRLPVINQLNYADPWFYTAYAWAPKHQFAIFGWNYFSVRFPAILGIGVFERAFGAADGYLLLRYGLAIISGSSVYLCVRRFASLPVALSAATMLYLQPFFSRMLLWDYTSFLEVSVGLSGVALWYWSDGRRLAWALLPGAALAIAVFANGLFATALFVLVAIEGVAAVRGGRRATINYAARLSISAGTALAVFVIGYLGYLTILGSLSPYDLLRPTIKFLSENSKQSALYQQPVSSWLFHELRIWMPVVTCVGLVAVLRRRILDVGVQARVAQMCVGYTAFLWLYRFAITSSVVETWWAYSIVVVATAPAVGVLLSELTKEPRVTRRTAAAAVGPFLGVALIVRDVPSIDRIYHTVSEHSILVIGVLAVGIASATLMSVDRSKWRGAGVAITFAVLAAMSYAPSILDGRGTTGIFVPSGSQEWTAYKAAQRFLDVVQNYDSPSHRVFLWFPGTAGYVSMTWADLPQDADTLNEIGVSESLEQLKPLGVARLDEPQVKYVMILYKRFPELSDARGALARGGFAGNVVRHADLVTGALHYALIELTRK
jgi:hypothetical protein